MKSVELKEIFSSGRFRVGQMWVSRRHQQGRGFGLRRYCAEATALSQAGDGIVRLHRRL